ncbi:MAG: GNAT family N-acetyltransferase [Devosia sp.]
MQVVRGEGVVLEPQVVAHAAQLYPLLSDPELYHYMDGKPADEAAFRVRLGKLETRLSGDGSEDWLNWVVRDDAGTMVGYVQATVYRNGLAEVAWVIGTAFQRRGHARAATLAMLDELAVTYSVNRVRGQADAGNIASIRLMERMGFRPIPDLEVQPDVVYEKTLP